MSSSMSRESRVESSRNDCPPCIVHRDERSLEIDGRNNIQALAFLVDSDGKHIVAAGGWEEKIRRWQAEDGKAVGTPMEAGGTVLCLAVSRDGKRVVSGSYHGSVMVWNAENGDKVAEFNVGRNSLIFAVDVSPDGTKFATGSNDKTACVWSLSTSQRLFSPLQHDYWVVGVKFSPDGTLFATATATGTCCPARADRHSIRIYDSRDGSLLTSIQDTQIRVTDVASNQYFAWASDSKQLFVLSYYGDINCLDVSTGTILFQWPIHSRDRPGCIVLAPNGKLAAASARTSVSFWDTTTHEKIGPIIEHTDVVASMDISANYEVATSAGKTITVTKLCDILPSHYLDIIVRDGEAFPVNIDKHYIEETLKLPPSRTEEERTNSTIVYLEEEISRVKGGMGNVKEIIESFATDILPRCARHDALGRTISTLDSVVQELRTMLPRLVDGTKADEYSKTITHLEQDVASVKVAHAELEQMIASVITEIYNLCVKHDGLHNELVAAEQELRAIQPLCPSMQGTRVQWEEKWHIWKHSFSDMIAPFALLPHEQIQQTM